MTPQWHSVEIGEFRSYRQEVVRAARSLAASHSPDPPEFPGVDLSQSAPDSCTLLVHSARADRFTTRVRRTKSGIVVEGPLPAMSFEQMKVLWAGLDRLAETLTPAP